MQFFDVNIELNKIFLINKYIFIISFLSSIFFI